MSLPLVDRKPAFAARGDLPASRRRYDSSSHLWPGGETHIYLKMSKYRKVQSFILHMCLLVPPGRQSGTFPTGTERLWHRLSHHWTERRNTKARLVKLKRQEQRLKPLCIYLILTPPERLQCISRSDWNYHSVQFWHFQKIPAEELPQVSTRHSNTK